MINEHDVRMVYELNKLCDVNDPSLLRQLEANVTQLLYLAQLAVTMTPLVSKRVKKKAAVNMMKHECE